MTNFNELQEETREIITDLLNDGSDPMRFILLNITSLIMILIL